MMDLSVIIPVYNVEKYIEKCIKSVSNLPIEKYEIICIDDCSADKSKYLLKKYASINKKIKILYHEKNRGAGAARNTGLKYAKGRYILFLDSDDYINSDGILEIYTEAVKNNLDIFYFNADIISYDNEFTKEKYIEKYIETNEIITGKEAFCTQVENNNFCPTVWNALWKREFIISNRLYFYEGIIFEDNIFVCNALMLAKRIVMKDICIYVYRNNRKGSVMYNSKCNRTSSLFVLIAETYNLWCKNCYDERLDLCFEKYLRNRYIEFYYENIRNPIGLEIPVGNPAVKGLYKILKEPKKLYLSLSDDNINQLKNKNNIVVYGAGRGAISVIKQLKENNIDVKMVAVSDKNRDLQNICGINVCEFQEIINKTNYTYVLAVTEKFRKEIIEYINTFAITDIIVAKEC